MNSLIYVYSKFTEEFLLLGAAGFFALLSIYCYHWVIQKRRMGIARNQIPSAVVKAYLSQLINEAESVRKQLFGMTDGGTIPAPNFGSIGNFNVSAENPAGNAAAPAGAAINPDLMARINSLENQLRDKESLVVNINVEKNKLLQEIENLRTNSGPAAANSSNQNQLLDKIKNLEARLEEYSLFEEDLANLKRLQQENADLKKKLSDAGGASPKLTAAPSPASEPAFEKKTLTAVPNPGPEIITPAEPTAETKHALDQEAIDALLNGKPATPPVAAAPAPAPAPAPAAEAPKPTLQAVPAAPPLEAQPAPQEIASTPNPDQFEKLVDSVETSLDAAPAESPTAPVAAASTDEPMANKTDEELLKEFENLLNS